MTIYLDGENISIGGTIEFIQCSTCKYESFALQLSTDNDMVYERIIGLTSNKKNELLLTRLKLNEYNNFDRLTDSQISERVNEDFNRTDFEFYRSKNFSRSNGQKIWARICPKCENDFVVKNKLPFDKFIKSGGKVICYSVHER